MHRIEPRPVAGDYAVSRKHGQIEKQNKVIASVAKQSPIH
jgi:hypothetical protein